MSGREKYRRDINSFHLTASLSFHQSLYCESGLFYDTSRWVCNLFILELRWIFFFYPIHWSCNYCSQVIVVFFPSSLFHFFILNFKIMGLKYYMYWVCDVTECHLGKTILIWKSFFLFCFFRGRLLHGRHFTYKSITGDTAITFVSTGVEGAFATEEHPYAAHGPWLQVFYFYIFFIYE